MSLLSMLAAFPTSTVQFNSSLDFILIASNKKLPNASLKAEINYKSFIYITYLEVTREDIDCGCTHFNL